MNILIKSTLAAAMSASLLLPMAAQAAVTSPTTSVKINGTIIAHACKVTIKAIEMGSVSTKTLNEVGALSDKKDLTINLTECVKNTTATVTFVGESPSPTNLLAVKTSESGTKRDDVGIEIYKKAGAAIALGGTDTHVLQSDENKLEYQVAYKAIKLPVAIGGAIGTLNVNITYS